MSFETWGTFSVADHLAPRAFVADVLLYESKRVVPRVLEASGYSFRYSTLDAALRALLA